MNRNAPKKIKLFYISGAARSGSTVLGLILQQIPGLCHVGELYHIWTRGFLHDEFCSCGIRFSCCPFWSKVTEEAFGSQHNVDAHRIKKEIRFVQRMRRLPQILLPWLQGSEYRRLLCKHTERLMQLYKAILTVSGSHIIVDSSKSPLYGLLLSRIPVIEIHIIHLIRDSRAVAFSWQRKKLRHQPGCASEPMPTYKSFQSACTWNLANALSQALRLVSVTYQRVRYEDLVTNVPVTVGQLLSPLQEACPREFRLDGIGASSRGHAMSGNPMRFRSDPIHIRLDDEWKASMARKEKFIAAAITFPLLLYYGYRF